MPNKNNVFLFVSGEICLHRATLNRADLKSELWNFLLSVMHFK